MERVYRRRKDRRSKGTERDVSLSIFSLEIKGYIRKREIKDRREARTMVVKRGKKNMGKEQTEKDEDAEERGREIEKRKMEKDVREWK